MDNIILHVGLGKTGTTTLQKYVFPMIAKKNNYQYFGPTELNNFFNPERKFDFSHPYLKTEKKLKDLTDSQKLIISFESLSGKLFDPYNYEKCADINQKIFGKDAHIILSLRKPSEFLTSVYVQAIQENIIVKPEDFFLSNDKYNQKILKLSDENKKKIWCLEQFDYEKLIEIYMSKFKKVSVIKHESIFDLSFINKFEMFLMNDQEVETIKKKFRKKKLNRTMSITGVKFSFIVNSFLKIFSSDLEKFEKLRKKLYFRNPNNNFFLKLINLLIMNLNVKYFFNTKADRFLPYKKFKLNFNKLNFIDMNTLEKRYINIKEKTYTSVI